MKQHENSNLNFRVNLWFTKLYPPSVYAFSIGWYAESDPNTKEATYMTNKSMGEIISTFRKEKGMTQEHVAEVFGVTSRTVSRWENGVSFS